MACLQGMCGTREAGMCCSFRVVKMTFEQNAEGDEGAIYRGMWRGSVSGCRIGSCKGPEASRKTRWQWAFGEGRREER